MLGIGLGLGVNNVKAIFSSIIEGLMVWGRRSLYTWSETSVDLWGFGSPDDIAQAFSSQVIADGGTFEAINCLTQNIGILQALNQIATSFNLQVVADSGTFEQINCLQTNITNLQNININ
jgi:hypothetical protein